jgi:hypothetical protein
MAAKLPARFPRVSGSHGGGVRHHHRGRSLCIKVNSRIRLDAVYSPLDLNHNCSPLKGLAQGYIVTAAMLIMTAWGRFKLRTILSVGSVSRSSCLHPRRTTKPKHRIYLFNRPIVVHPRRAGRMNFNKFRLLFMVLLGLPWSTSPISRFNCWIDTVSAIEKRNQYAYIFVQEFGFYIGRFAGCGLFILLATQVSNTFALRFALLIVAVLQLLSVFVARRMAWMPRRQSAATATVAFTLVSVGSSFFTSKPGE